MPEEKYPPHIQKLIDHYLDRFNGRVLLDGKEAAVVLDSTEGNLAVCRCKKTGPDFLRLGRSVKYNLFTLADYIWSSSNSMSLD